MRKDKVTITKLCEFIEKRILNKFDLIIFVEGKRGMGKSTFLYVLGKKLNARGIVKFNPRTNLVYAREDSIKALANDKHSFILNDEMINVAYNRDFYEQDQKVLIKALNNYRDSCNVFCGCVPKFIDLDKQMQKLCEMRVQIHRRGLAEIHGQLKGFYLDDPWNTKDNIKKEMKIRTKIKSKMKTQRFFVKYRDLTEKERIYYEQLKHERRNKVFNNDIEERNPHEIFYNKVYEQLKNLEIPREQFNVIAEIGGKTIKTLRANMITKIKEDNDETRTLKEMLELAEVKRQQRVKDKKKIKIIAIPINEEEKFAQSTDEAQIPREKFAQSTTEGDFGELFGEPNNLSYNKQDDNYKNDDWSSL